MNQPTPRRGFLAGAVPVALQGIGGPGAPHCFDFCTRESLGCLAWLSEKEFNLKIHPEPQNEQGSHWSRRPPFSAKRTAHRNTKIYSVSFCGNQGWMRARSPIGIGSSSGARSTPEMSFSGFYSEPVCGILEMCILNHW